MSKNTKNKKHKKAIANTRNTIKKQPVLDSDDFNIEALTHKSDFVSYLKLLKPFAKKYTVLICVNDTPCGGADFTPQVGAKINELGTKINLAGRYRCPYAAIIHKGKLLFEKIGAPQTEVIECETVLEGASIKIKSVPFPISKDVTDFKCGITVNGLSYGSLRGISFLVFDMENNSLLDFVRFDVFPHISAGEHFKYPPAERTKQIIAYKDAHPEVTVVTYVPFRFPVFNNSENEKFILNFKNGFGYMMSTLKTIPALEKYFDRTEDIKEVITPPKSYHDMYGVRHFEDTKGKLVNTHGGIRHTTEQPQKYKRRLFIVGNCRTFGVGSADKDTIASYLQKMLNQHEPNAEIIVYNYGFYCGVDNASDSSELITILNALPVTPGDIVLIDHIIKRQSGIDAIDMLEVSTRPHNYGELFFDESHFTPEGNYALADNIFKHFMKNNFYTDNYIAQTKAAEAAVPAPANAPSNDLNLPGEAVEQLQSYKNILKDFYNEMFPRPLIGSIVMNCNPFTLGHRYLIEEAAKQVAHLMIFVVQEDMSFFPFDDRIALVDAGTSDLANVTVIPSGQFIISTLTFSEYFNKSELQDRNIDSSLDINLFGQEIAPCLDIKVRFVGEEPFDMVTRQYNETMKAVLPKYGIEVVEIPRKEYDSKAISASRVRELLEERNWDSIEKLVPPSTLVYLRKRFL